MVAYELVPSVKLTCRAANSASGLSSLGAGKPRILSSSDCESEMSGSSYRRCFQDNSPGMWMIFRYDPSSEYSLEQIARKSQQRQKCATSRRGTYFWFLRIFKGSRPSQCMIAWYRSKSGPSGYVISYPGKGITTSSRVWLARSSCFNTLTSAEDEVCQFRLGLPR